MSILNLNTPQGRGPVGKKSMKLWMGVGLLAAVLGFGSTLAANISINSPGGTSEFGQGVTQTIFCGADEASVIVTPASAYTNTTTWRSPNPTFTFITRFSGEGETSVNPVTIYGSTSSISPKFASASPYPSAKVGWWLPSSSSTASPYPTQPTAEQVATTPGNYFFTERDSNGKFKRPASPSPSPVPVAVRVSDELSNFKLGKVTISNIPAACNGVNFVLSSYGATGSAQTLSSSGSGITEVAVLWNQGKTDTYPSKSRTVFSDTKSGSSCLVTSQQTSSSLTFTFATPNISAKDLSKLVIETQEDAIGVGDCDD
jgi:hypothetical protein